MKFVMIIKNKDTNEVVYTTEMNALVAGFASGEASASVSFRGNYQETVSAVAATNKELTKVMEEGF